MVSGSPSQSERLTRTALHATMNAYVTSLRAARFTTRPPRHVIRKPKNATLPHCPGETHTSGVRSISATIAKFVGLKMCFPRQRMTNLLPTAIAAPARTNRNELLRSKRQSERPEIAALRGSNRTLQIREQSAWVVIAITRIAAHRTAVVSKSSAVRP